MPTWTVLPKGEGNRARTVYIRWGSGGSIFLESLVKQWRVFNKI